MLKEFLLIIYIQGGFLNVPATITSTVITTENGMLGCKVIGDKAIKGIKGAKYNCVDLDRIIANEYE